MLEADCFTTKVSNVIFGFVDTFIQNLFTQKQMLLSLTQNVIFIPSNLRMCERCAKKGPFIRSVF